MLLRLGVAIFCVYLRILAHRCSSPSMAILTLLSFFIEGEEGRDLRGSGHPAPLPHESSVTRTALTRIPSDRLETPGLYLYRRPRSSAPACQLLGGNIVTPTRPDVCMTAPYPSPRMITLDQHYVQNLLDVACALWYVDALVSMAQRMQRSSTMSGSVTTGQRVRDGGGVGILAHRRLQHRSICG